MNIEIEPTLSVYWHATNASFEKKLNANNDYVNLGNKMSFCLGKNHWMIVWQWHTERFHVDDREWHYVVDCICLNAFGHVWVVFEAMHEVNMYKFHIYFLQVVSLLDFYHFD